MSEEKKVPYLTIHSIRGTKEFYNREALDTLLDVLDGPSGRLLDNLNMGTIVVPGRPDGKRILKARPHRIDPMQNDMPDVYIAHTVPISELVYARSYQELFQTLENKYGLERTINEDGDICYMTEGEYTPKQELDGYINSHGMEVKDGKIIYKEDQENS